MTSNRIWQKHPESKSWKPEEGKALDDLKINVRKVPGEATSDEFCSLMTPDPRNPDDPPLGTQLSKVIKVELLGPGLINLLRFLEKPLFHFFSPVIAGFALSSLVSETPSLSGTELFLAASVVVGGAGGFQSRRD